MSLVLCHEMRIKEGGAKQRYSMSRRQQTSAKSKSMTAVPAQLSLFGQPQLLEGEDAAAYDELLARLRAAVTPVDIIEEMFIADVASLEWEVLRWRRLKLALLRAAGLKVLKKFSREKLEYPLYSDRFARDLTEILEENLPDDQREDFAQRLAHECARDEADAVDKVNEILGRIGLDLDTILNRAQADRAEELAQKYMQGERGAIKLIDQVLSDASQSLDGLMANALVKQLDHIERIDRLAAVAESRRNTSLREIDRRRAVLGETLRRKVQEIEDAEFQVIEKTLAEGKNAA